MRGCLQVEVDIAFLAKQLFTVRLAACMHVCVQQRRVEERETSVDWLALGVLVRRCLPRTHFRSHFTLSDASPTLRSTTLLRTSQHRRALGERELP